MNPYIQIDTLKPPEEFLFPFPPYKIQKDFMKKLYSVLEEGKFGIFESPTGTGKSLSIICGALCWLCDHENHKKSSLLESIAFIEKQLRDMEANSVDDWLSAQSEQTRIASLKTDIQLQLNGIIENEDVINNIRKKLENEASELNISETKNFSALSIQINESELDEDVLLEDITSSDELDKLEEEEENKFEGIKIYFCSRTHSQLSQFVGEVQCSPYSQIRVVPLASRQTYCVNPDVKKLKNITLINEKCLDLQNRKSSKATKKSSSNEIIKKKKYSSTGCPFYNKTTIEKLKEKIIFKIHSIEELVTEGKRLSACPYYATRAAIPLSQLVVIPYNTLLHKSTREASRIKIKNNIIIIDEAHNLLDAIGNMHSSYVTGNQLCLCYNQLTTYKEKYEKMFSPNNLLFLNQLIYIVEQMISLLGGKAGCGPIESSRKGTEAKIFSLPEFVHIAGIDNYNLYKLLDFCQRSKIAHKLQNFTQKYPVSVNLNNRRAENGLQSFLKNIATSRNNVPVSNSGVKEIFESKQTTMHEEISNNPIFSIIAFIESLTNHCKDGRISLVRQSTVGRGSFKFLLLNPAAHFKDIVREARSIIVAGGTMQPISEFQELLFESAGAEASRIVTFSCGHVIPAENILPIVLCNGPSGRLLDFSFQTRNNFGLISEVGRVLDNVCNAVPAGIVCFFPSYEYEQIVYQHFEKSGVLEKLSKKKKIFREPKKTSDVDGILEEYALHISQSIKRPELKPNGCLLFSVIGGKLSEGLNFSDDLGRCIIVIGLPYPNIKSPELQEKMSYLDKTCGSGAGQKHYENLCMKAVNQSIGRAVRHRNDYSAVLLLDHRYSRTHIQRALPQWMTPSLITCEKFGPAFSSLIRFFKTKSLEKSETCSWN